MFLRRSILALLSTLLLTACTPALTSTKGIYGPTPESSAHVSDKQIQRVIMSDFDLVDTKHAIHKALGLEGIAPDVVKHRLISGVVKYEPNPYTMCYCSFAAYLQPSSRGRTQVTLLIDDRTAFGKDAHKLAATLVSSINTVLASYE